MRAFPASCQGAAFLAAVRDRRRELRVKQEVLARELGMTQGAYARIERGASELKFDIFIFLCQRLEIDGKKYVL